MVTAMARVRGRRDYAMVLMLTAVVGAICHIADTAIDLGRSAGWWQ
jgi:hypothetical protein